MQHMTLDSLRIGAAGCMTGLAEQQRDGLRVVLAGAVEFFDSHRIPDAAIRGLRERAATADAAHLTLIASELELVLSGTTIPGIPVGSFTIDPGPAPPIKTMASVS